MWEISQMLERYELNLVLMNSGLSEKIWSIRFCLREELLIAVPQIHPLNEKAVYVEGSCHRNLDLNWLEGENLILQNPNQSIRADVDAALEGCRRTSRENPGDPNIETAIQMTAEGLGISFNRESYAGNMKYRKKVNYYTMGESPRKTAFMAGYRQGMFVPSTCSVL